MTTPFDPRPTDPVSGPAPAAPRVALPAWARALDLLTLLLLAFAVSTAVFGGFRLRIGSVRIAQTSALRALLGAGALAFVRHYFARQRPIYEGLWRGLVSLVRDREWRAALAVTLGTRPVIWLIGFLAIATIGYPKGSPPFRLFEDELRNLPVRWDAGWYLGIATEGYDWSPEPGVQNSIVFFPGYPMAVRFLGRILLGNEFQLYVLAAVLLSVMAFTVAMAYLYRLSRERLDDEQATAVLWMAGAYPFAIFFSAPYTESLYLAAAIAAFYYMERRQLTAAGLWGLLAGLTRPNGAFLSVPLGLMAIGPWLPSVLGAWSLRDRPREIGPTVRAIAAAAMPGIGMLLFSAYVYSVTGRPFFWAEGHAAWGRTYQGLAPLVTTRAHYLLNDGLIDYIQNRPYDFLNLLGVLFALSMT